MLKVFSFRLALVSIALAAAILVGHQVRSGTAAGVQEPMLDPAAYLPVLFHTPNYGIHGTVTMYGTPQQNIPVDLRFFNGATWSTQASTTTDATGMFSFLGAPDLIAGQRYYVRYLNTSLSSNLYTWHTALIDSYSGGSVHIGDFDIRNITLNSPASGAVVALPRTFTWGMRFNTPTTDSYEYNLFDYADGDPYFYTDPALGFVNSYTLSALPPGFDFGTYYVWDMWVYDGLGGYGISYWAYWVKFTGSEMVEMKVPSAQVTRNADILLDLPRVQKLPTLETGGQP